MKLKPILILFACTLLLTTFAAAEVPSLINYQGRLTGPGGTPASGTRNFELKLYDAQAGGNLLYTEDVGTITLGEGGVYSFQFGASGTSVATRSETLATTDGTLTVFNHALSATALPGSVSLSDGTFTWSQAAGSSAPASFIGSFVGASGIASAIYIQGAPAAGTSIEVTFHYEHAGIVGALSSGSSHWLELTVNGNVQATRERVLAVPFAQISGKSTEANFLAERRNTRVFLRNGFNSMPGGRSSGPNYPLVDSRFMVPDAWKRISKLEIVVARHARYANGTTDLSAANVKLRKWDPQTNSHDTIEEFHVYDPTVNLPNRSYHEFSYTIPWDVPFSETAQYYLEFTGGGLQDSRTQYRSIHATVDLSRR